MESAGHNKITADARDLVRAFNDVIRRARAAGKISTEELKRRLSALPLREMPEAARQIRTAGAEPKTEKENGDKQ